MSLLPTILCALCSDIFAEPRKKSARIDVKQTYEELRLSAELKKCQLCYLRWMQRLDVEAERPYPNIPETTWTKLQYHLSLSESSATSKIYFDYTNELTGKKEVDHPEDFPGYSRNGDDVPEVLLDQACNTGSSKALAQVSSWYQECLKNHDACKSLTTEEQAQPTRLIHLGDGLELEARLVETKDLSVRVKYCTVSHSWGQHRITCLNRENFAQFKIQVPPDAISQSFHDAMLVAKRLSISYIWIDSLCIIQRDLNDWQYESLHMSHVYKNAVCNIGATGAKDGSIGCFYDRSEIDSRACWVNVWVGTSQEMRFISDFRFWRRHVLQSPLGKRGWIVQERHLARRMMHFTRWQIYWECREQTASEIFPYGLPEEFMTQFMLKGTNEHLKIGGEIPVSRALELWARFVRDYSSANSTDERDKLVAISGLAKELAPHIKSRYLAGLWECGLPSMLLWRIETPLHTSDPALTAKRLNTYQAPSWSWASLCSPIVLTTKPNDRIFVSIIEAHIVPVANDEFGQIKSGYLKITAYLAKAQAYVPHKSNVPNRTTYLVRDGSKDPKDPMNFLAKLESCNLSEVVTGQSVFCMPVTGFKNGVSGLVLESVKRDEADDSMVFRRLGVFSYSEIATDQAEVIVGSARGLGLFETPCREFGNRQPGDNSRIQLAEHDSEGIPRYTFIIE